MYISVIVPYKEGEQYIKRFFEGYCSQTLERSNYCLTFVNNKSTDNTENIIKQFVDEQELDNVYLVRYSDKASSCASRNYGVRHSQGDILVFTDIDCLMEKDFLKKIYMYFSAGIQNPIAGKVIIDIEDRANYWEVYDSYFNMDNEKMLKKMRIATANFAILRDTFEKIGYFQELISSGDSEYGERINRYNITTEYKDDVIVFHPPRKTYADISKKLLRIAYGEGQRANQENKKITYMTLIYVLKAFNIINLYRIWKKLKRDISFFRFSAFAIKFTNIRIRQIKAFRNGFLNKKINVFNM